MEQKNEQTNKQNSQLKSPMCTSIKLILKDKHTLQFQMQHFNVKCNLIFIWIYTLCRRIDEDSEWGIKNCHSESISLSLWYCWMSDIYILNLMMMMPRHIQHTCIRDSCTGMPCIKLKKKAREEKKTAHLNYLRSPEFHLVCLSILVFVLCVFF